MEAKSGKRLSCSCRGLHPTLISLHDMHIRPQAQQGRLSGQGSPSTVVLLARVMGAVGLGQAQSQSRPVATRGDELLLARVMGAVGLGQAKSQSTPVATTACAHSLFIQAQGSGSYTLVAADNTHTVVACEHIQFQATRCVSLGSDHHRSLDHDKHYPLLSFTAGVRHREWHHQP